jgi:hypothetical protein
MLGEKLLMLDHKLLEDRFDPFERPVPGRDMRLS